ncbi:ELL-associated factor 2 [Eutrema salsugineum]|uniref:ELL-associated factor 2 n=1 Tax=Eutrema salsugineum TaxID=72664 RepID=UPI000CECED91|nr:ELL-associated factor 2 [Eutrema salsugineum]
MNDHNEEPSIAPEPNRWYNITLGPSLLNDGHSHNSPRFCSFRYEFKPASIDRTKPGSFHKSNDNKVTLEFQNNQIGKPKVSFDGVSEDNNDKDAILFFDGETFRLEKLHRAVKRLRYRRFPSESPIAESYSQPVCREAKVKFAQIDINNPVSLDHEKEEDPHESEEDVNIDDDDDDENDNDGQDIARKETTLAKEFRTGGLDIDINLPHPAEMEDEEIADVDINDDESYKGLSAAEALRAQVNAEAREEEGKSSSSSSESSESRAESSGSGSSSSTSSKSRNSGSES